MVFFSTSIRYRTFTHTINYIISSYIIRHPIWVIIHITRTIKNFTLLNFHHRYDFPDITMMTQTSNSTADFNRTFYLNGTLHNSFLDCTFDTNFMIVTTVLCPISNTSSLGFLANKICVNIRTFD
ncbi:Uncharacterised protein [Streptococcus pneumoniae]|nr:Uncharacterised protein [Streptococcus pneumoniae]CAG5146600.1 Uncharacterised protein [Streptococcus pneumoniae]CAG5278231.1 Uncharacterised protein [Streptococcus pneumoniae]CJE07358.1 Uncharacterised protein [Streptococcus pneumoniae]CXH06242.1 Uncharacterised protein [Streptococcus pneumoniae]